jgi:hypothetical protein
MLRRKSSAGEAEQPGQDKQDHHQCQVRRAVHPDKGKAEDAQDHGYFKGDSSPRRDHGMADRNRMSAWPSTLNVIRVFLTPAPGAVRAVDGHPQPDDRHQAYDQDARPTGVLSHRAD